MAEQILDRMKMGRPNRADAQNKQSKQTAYKLENVKCLKQLEETVKTNNVTR